jgi:23S rRNA (cytosine1962-C5)-methyltransferase
VTLDPRYLATALQHLEEALEARAALTADPGTTAYRVVDVGAEADWSLDAYGRDLVLGLLPDLRTPLEPAVVARELADGRELAHALGTRLHARAVYLKLRPLQANTVVDATAAGLTPSEPVFGLEAAPGGAGVVLENGLHFHVRLGEGLPTGIYLDQRDNRRWLLDNAAGLRVLNTFAYTCAFSVAAAAGGAARTVSLDAAGPALDIGQANFALNDLTDPDKHDFLRGDVFHWLPRMTKRGDRFDLIVLDPPSYSRVKQQRFSAAQDYATLVATALGLLAPGGQLLACTNALGLNGKQLEQKVREGAKSAGREVVEVQHRPTALDHPSGRMKALVVRLR